jgi:hypothetical protein
MTDSLAVALYFPHYVNCALLCLDREHSRDLQLPRSDSSLLVATSLMLAIRTANWAANDGSTTSSVEWAAEIH